MGREQPRCISCIRLTRTPVASRCPDEDLIAGRPEGEPARVRRGHLGADLVQVEFTVRGHGAVACRHEHAPGRVYQGLVDILPSPEAVPHGVASVAVATATSPTPVTILRTWADPHVVVAGTPVRQWVELVRHRRCTYATTWTVTDSSSMVHAFGPIIRVAPGEAGPTPQPAFGIEFATPANMAPGPATLRVSLRGECPENVLDDWWPRVVDMPPVEFDAVARPVPPHDASPGVAP